jgi:hypothetical protein
VRGAGRQEVCFPTEALHLNRRTPAQVRRGFALTSGAKHQSWSLISFLRWCTLYLEVESDLDQSWKAIVKTVKWAAVILLVVLTAMTILLHKLSWICLVPEYCK